MTQFWTIVSRASGDVLDCVCTPDANTRPESTGQYAWTDDMESVAVDGPPDPIAHRWSGTAWVENLDPIRAMLRDAICSRAEAVRGQFITPGSGQAITYARKEAEARAWVSGHDPATAPFLAAEAETTGVSIDALAETVVRLADAWVATGAVIEARRRALLVAIEAAPTRAALDAIDITAGWPGQ